MLSVMMLMLINTQELRASVHWDENAVALNRVGDSLRFDYPGTFPGTKVGEPQLPVAVRFFALPSDAVIKDVAVENLVPGPVFKNAAPFVMQWPRLPGLPEPVVVAGKVKTGLYPEKLSKILYVGKLRGITLVAVAVYPMQADLNTKEVRFYRSFDVVLRYDSKQKQLQAVEEPWASYIDNIIENPGVPRLPGWGTDYMILTNDALAPEFQRLAEWRKAQGFKAEVVTVEWVASVYSGSDLPEKIRNFLRDAYENQGLKYLLIGGDQYIVPFRMAYQPIGYPNYGDSIPTDLYYACLDGSWNPDGDATWGEYPDTIDFLPDIFVSRVPFRQRYEVRAFVDKLMAYETQQNDAQRMRAVVHAADLFNSGDGAYYGRRIASRFPEQFRVDSMFEATIGHDITRQEMRDTLSQGPAYVFMMGHGNWWRTQLDHSTGVCFELNDGAVLSNNGHPFFLVMLSCHGNSVFESSVGKACFMNPSAGAVASFGSSKLDFADYTTPVVESLYTNVFSHGLNRAGVAELTATTAWAGLALVSPLYRHLIFAYNLMGDPLTLLPVDSLEYMQVWHDPSASNQLMVSVSDSRGPVKGAVITLMAKDMFMVQQADSQGNALFQDINTSSDSLELCVSAPSHLMFRDKVPVIKDSGRLGFAFSYQDGIDNIPKAGDDGRVKITVSNKGLTETGPLSCTVRASSSATILSSVHGLVWSFDLPSIPQGQSAEFSVPVAISPRAKPVDYLDLVLECQTPKQSFRDSARFVVFGPDLKLTGVKCLGTSISKNVLIDIRNTGPGPAVDVKCIAVNGGDTLGVISYPRIESEQNTGYNKGFNVPVSISSLTLLLEVGGGLPLDTFQLVLETPPTPPSALSAQPDPTGVCLQWDTVQNAAFYKIYRSTSPQGPFKAVSGLVANSIYTDLLESDSVFYYKVASLDSFLNEGSLSPVVSARRNPRTGPFDPVYASGIGYPSAQAADIDPDYPGKELVLAGLYEYIYAFKSDGTVLPGWPLRFPDGKIYGTPAIADLNGDGVQEVIFSVFVGGNSYVYAVEPDGSVCQGWPRLIPGDNIIFPPAVAEVDTCPGLELMLKGQHGTLYLLHNDSLMDTQYDTGPDNALFPALADLDNDGFSEIITACSDGSVHVFKSDWSELKGFPVLTDSVSPYYGGVAIGDISPVSPGPEIVFTGSASGSGTYVGVISTESPEFLFPVLKLSSGYTTTPPIIADLNNDSKPDIVIMQRDSMMVLDYNGVVMTRQKVRFYVDYWPAAGFAASADINDDGNQEVLFGSYNGLVYAVDWRGNMVPGFPIQTSLGSNSAGNVMVACPLITDLNEDGRLDLFMPSFARYLYGWELGSSTGAMDWPSIRHDHWNTGFYKFQIPASQTLAVGQLQKNLKGFCLMPPTPNPASDVVNLRFNLPVDCEIQLVVYDITGRRVMNVIDGRIAAGFYNMSVDISRLPAGVYFIRMEQRDQQFVQKITKIRTP